MADPRFYDNRGPHTLAELCARANLTVPEGVDGSFRLIDVAGLANAGPAHLSFFDGTHGARGAFLETKAGVCIVRQKEAAVSSAVAVRAPSVPHAYAAAARAFYPDHELMIGAQDTAIHPSAQLDEDVILAPGVVIGPGAEIGRGTKIGAYSVVGRGVTIGRQGEIGSHVSIGVSHIGDDSVIQPGARIGGSGFGFASSANGHIKIPQLGRVIIQDRVEIGANCTIDRGMLGDTVIGEGTKIDNQVHIGHNTQIGRHCVLAGQVGTSGSAVLGEFVMIGGKGGVADHVVVGDRARLAAASASMRDVPAGQDYGGIPARPIRQWHREMAILARMAQRRKTDE